jgi:hypothetical protein
MAQLNVAGLAGQGGDDGVAATEPGAGAGDAGADAGEFVAGEDSMLQPPSAAQAAAAAAHRDSSLVDERGVTPGSLRKAARSARGLGR